jgi:hypothetical protein
MQSVTSGAVSQSLSYSTSEINTGTKWIDGSDIYRQVFEFSNLNLTGNDTWNNTGISVGNKNRVITCIGVNATGTLFTMGGCALDIGTTIHLLNYRPNMITITKLILEYTKS